MIFFFGGKISMSGTLNYFQNEKEKVQNWIWKYSTFYLRYLVTINYITGKPNLLLISKILTVNCVTNMMKSILNFTYEHPFFTCLGDKQIIWWYPLVDCPFIEICFCKFCDFGIIFFFPLDLGNMIIFWKALSCPSRNNN